MNTNTNDTPQPASATRPDCAPPIGSGLPRRLTGDAAFAAAVCAGVPVETRMEGGHVVMTLAHPVDVWDEGNGMLKVFTRPNSPNKGAEV